MCDLGCGLLLLFGKLWENVEWLIVYYDGFGERRFIVNVFLIVLVELDRSWERFLIFGCGRDYDWRWEEFLSFGYDRGYEFIWVRFLSFG